MNLLAKGKTRLSNLKMMQKAMRHPARAWNRRLDAADMSRIGGDTERWRLALRTGGPHRGLRHAALLPCAPDTKATPQGFARRWAP
jgi:hypothetical protein